MDNLAGSLGVALLTVALLVCSAFFSSSETAIFSLPKGWVDRQAAATTDRRATLLKELSDDPHRLLVTLLVGNNIVNVAISSVITLVVAGYLPASSTLVVATLVTSVLVLVFGEIVPKAYGLANAQDWSLRTAFPLRVVELGLSPLITVFDIVTRRLNALISVDPDIEKPYLE